MGANPSLPAISRHKWYEKEIAEGRYCVPGHKLVKIHKIDSIQYPTKAQQAKIDRMGNQGHFWECECGNRGTFDYRGNLTPAYTHATHAIRNGRAVKNEKPLVAIEVYGEITFQEKE